MKTILITLLTLFSLSVMGQNRYYIIDADSIAPALVISAQTVGNPQARLNIAQDSAVVKMSVPLAPTWAGVNYTASQIRPIMATATWDTTTAEPIESEDRITLARARGDELTNAFFARIDRNVYDGTWTTGQGALAYSNYSDVFGLLNEGLFDLVVKLEAAGQIVPQGVVTQAMIDNLIAKLTAWEADHPRP